MFYDRFLELCEREGVLPSSVARDIGLSNSSATYWKRGSTPKSDTFQKLADYFGVSVDYLIGKTDDPYGLRRTMSATAGFDGSASATVDPTTAISPRARISAGLDKLNDKGQCVAADRVEELTKIPDYQKPKNPPEGR